MNHQKTALCVLAIVACAALVPASSGGVLPTIRCNTVGPLKPCGNVDALTNGALEGAATAGNGFTLYNGNAALSTDFHGGAQSVNLAASGAPDENNMMGSVRMTFNREVRLAGVNDVSYWYHMPTAASGRVAFAQIYLMLDSNGDRAPDACLVSDQAELAAGDWTQVDLGPTSDWVLVDSGCGAATMATPMLPFAVQRASTAVVLRMYVQVVASDAGVAWPDATPINVDDVMVMATMA